MNKFARIFIGPPGDTDKVKFLDPRVIKYNETGIIDVEYFNEREADDRFGEVTQRSSENDALFGTRLREAVRILRGR